MANYDDIFNASAQKDAEDKSFVSFDKDAWATQKKQERESAFAMIDETAQRMANDGGLFQSYLDVQARFDRYSVGNAVLITAQKADATQLSDFKGWKNNGVFIKKGESGIVLLEPGEEYTKEDGTVGVSYNSKKVFDISQTTAKAKDRPAMKRDERLLLKAIIHNAPCPIEISQKLPENINAVYRPDDKKIYVRPGLEAGDIFRGISQELAHAHLDDGAYKRSDHAFTAYCVSYVLCSRYNVPKDIPEFGRYDDLVSLLGTACEKDALRTIRKQLEADLASDEEVSLLAKWLPSVNASNVETVRKAKHIARYLGMSDAEYRKTLVELRKKIRIIENHLREKDYSFDYAKQPSKAMFKYRKAFLRNDGERYNAFLEAVSSGEKQLHADNLAPYEIVRSALNANRWGFNARLTDGEKAALNASWASLPDFCDNRNALAVVDTSGSMYCYDNALPAAVALSLGLYFGERNTGIFHNHFIEFSSRPQLIEIKGKTFAERLEYLCTFNEVADTNVEAVFDLILDAAVRNNVPQEELPETLYLISDMEFNACVRNASVSNFASAKRRFAEHGYRLPQIVFWNVASRNSNQPVTKNEQGVALVSGCTPRLFSMVASGDLSPYSVMMEIIESERYAKISA